MMSDRLEERLKVHLEQVVRERNPFFSSGGHFYAREYLRQEFRELGVDRSHHFEFRGSRHENLILDLPGCQGKSGESPILIGAHYDTVPGSPGADDNGSGLAVLLVLGAFFRENPPRYPIRLVAFDLEEYGLVGSEAYAEELKKEGQDLRLMVSLEMLGYRDTGPDSQRYPPPLQYFYPSTGDFIALIGNWRTRGDLRHLHGKMRENAQKCEFLPVPFGGYPVPDTRRSDHSPFWSRGYRALMVTDTANMRNPFYHGVGDTLDTLDLGFLAGVCRGLAFGIRSLP